MKKFVVIAILLIISFNLYANECIRVKENGIGDFNKKRELAWLGLAYCLDIDDKKATEEKLYTLSAHQECCNYIKIMDSNGAFEELKKHIDKKDFLNKKSQQGLQRLRACMIMYDSQEYNDEIERIVKKYCKDCK